MHMSTSCDMAATYQRVGASSTTPQHVGTHINNTSACGCTSTTTTPKHVGAVCPRTCSACQVDSANIPHCFNAALKSAIPPPACSLFPPAPLPHSPATYMLMSPLHPPPLPPRLSYSSAAQPFNSHACTTLCTTHHALHHAEVSVAPSGGSSPAGGLRGIYMREAHETRTPRAYTATITPKLHEVGACMAFSRDSGGCWC